VFRDLLNTFALSADISFYSFLTFFLMDYKFFGGMEGGADGILIVTIFHGENR
jgi:hypothetical protein